MVVGQRVHLPPDLLPDVESMRSRSGPGPVVGEGKDIS